MGRWDEGTRRRAGQGPARPWQRLVGWLELPEAVMLDLPPATVVRRGRCPLEHHRELLRYRDAEAVVQHRLRPLRGVGQRPEIERLAGGELVLRGRIDQIDYTPFPDGGA